MTLIVWVFCREDGSARVLGVKDEPDGSDMVQAWVTDGLQVAQLAEVAKDFKPRQILETI